MNMASSIKPFRLHGVIFRVEESAKLKLRYRLVQDQSNVTSAPQLHVLVSYKHNVEQQLHDVIWGHFIWDVLHREDGTQAFIQYITPDSVQLGEGASASQVKAVNFLLPHTNSASRKYYISTSSTQGLYLIGLSHADYAKSKTAQRWDVAAELLQQYRERTLFQTQKGYATGVAAAAGRSELVSARPACDTASVSPPA